METLFILWDNITECVALTAGPICVLILAFGINLAIQYCKIEKADGKVNNKTFKSKYLIAHPAACGLALLYAILSFYLGEKPMPGLLVGIFFTFLIIVTMVQNKDGGYIESLEGASGAIMLITASIDPYWLSILYAVIGIICFRNYKDDIKKEKCEHLWRYIIAYIETIIVFALQHAIELDTFWDVLWLNAVIISVFTLLLPLFEKKMARVIVDRVEINWRNGW